MLRNWVEIDYSARVQAFPESPGSATRKDRPGPRAQLARPEKLVLKFIVLFHFTNFKFLGLPGVNGPDGEPGRPGDF